MEHWDERCWQCDRRHCPGAYGDKCREDTPEGRMATFLMHDGARMVRDREIETYGGTP